MNLLHELATRPDLSPHVRGWEQASLVHKQIAHAADLCRQRRASSALEP